MSFFAFDKFGTRLPTLRNEFVRIYIAGLGWRLLSFKVLQGFIQIIHTSSNGIIRHTDVDIARNKSSVNGDTFWRSFPIRPQRYRRMESKSLVNNTIEIVSRLKISCAKRCLRLQQRFQLRSEFFDNLWVSREVVEDMCHGNGGSITARYNYEACIAV